MKRCKGGDLPHSRHLSARAGPCRVAAVSRAGRRRAQRVWTGRLARRVASSAEAPKVNIFSFRGPPSSSPPQCTPTFHRPHAAGPSGSRNAAERLHWSATSSARSSVGTATLSPQGLAGAAPPQPGARGSSGSRLTAHRCRCRRVPAAPDCREGRARRGSAVGEGGARAQRAFGSAPGEPPWGAGGGVPAPLRRTTDPPGSRRRQRWWSGAPPPPAGPVPASGLATSRAGSGRKRAGPSAPSLRRSSRDLPQSAVVFTDVASVHLRRVVRSLAFLPPYDSPIWIAEPIPAQFLWHSEPTPKGTMK